ncbi:phage integrase SAM-like domain-containing protein [uncultured Psychroserpens sp.]|uniref:phage integrase SAM-like domain-containing protein n=1 Tax=uncultured Psychroserpens sp. TaxID=255436 RepID=UPI00260823C8|nr:phage integrase SAM-like domain-containing protein [uncultured Psychroserpens sp.]
MSTTLKFYIRTPKKLNKNKRYPIYVRVLHNRKKAEGRTSLIPINGPELSNWIEASQRFSSKNKKYLSYNLYLNAIENEFHNYLRDHKEQMSTKTPHEMIDHLLSRVKPENKISILEAIQQFYENDILPDVDKAPGTKNNYKRSVTHFSNFLKHTKLDRLHVTEFKRQHASKFIAYLKKPSKKYYKIALNGQSVHSIVKNIKPFFTKLFLEEEITRNPFLGVKTTFKRTEKPRLTNDNFKSIIELDLSNNAKLDVYRDLFVFLCYTGLSYCDATDLRHSDIKNGYFSIQRKKSSVQTKQFLTKQTISLLEKYEGQLPEQRILPKRSLDKMNLNLKLIAALTGIEFSLSTYTARRFFRQSIHEAGIRESLVVKTLMGHTRTNDIDSHYFYIDDAILIKAKKKLQKHFKKIIE